MSDEFQMTKGASYKKIESADQTRRRLDMLFNKAFDSEAFEGIRLDKREVARFVAEKVRVLRLATNASGLRSLTWMIENTFYEAYCTAQRSKSESINFINPQDNIQ